MWIKRSRLLSSLWLGLLYLAWLCTSAFALDLASSQVLPSGAAEQPYSVSLDSLPTQAPSQAVWDQFRMWARKHYELDRQESLTAKLLSTQVESLQKQLSQTSTDFATRVLGLQEAQQNSATSMQNALDLMKISVDSSKDKILRQDIELWIDRVLLAAFTGYEIYKAWPK